MPPLRMLPAARCPPAARQVRSGAAAAHGAAERSHAAPAASHAPQRRTLLRAAAAALLLRAPGAVAEQLPQPPSGDCADCIGVVNETLAPCPLSAPSCVSVFSDDEAHFTAPWVVPEPRAQALAELRRIACGGEYEAGFTSAPFGRDRAAVAAFILETVAAFLTRQPLPPKPPLVRAGVGEKRAFDGRVDAESPGYLRVVFGESAAADANNSPVYDAEFVFPAGDELCAVRVASRSPGGVGESPRLELSYTSGVAWNANGARVLAEDLRKALRWELAPVVTGFDPRFNNERELWFERPFNALAAATRAGRAARVADGG